MSDDLYTEASVAQKLGVARADVKAVRDDLEKGRDWMLVSNQVVFTQEGRQAVLTRLAPAEGDAGPEMKKNDAQGPETGVVVVDRVPINPRIVMGFLQPSGEPVRVRVRSNVNFIRGMEIPCYREQSDVWVLDRRCPRWRGRW